jgi:hypothetical protein
VDIQSDNSLKTQKKYKTKVVLKRRFGHRRIEKLVLIWANDLALP